MQSHHGSPLVPRNGHTLEVGVVARISGCQNQKELSLEDQEDHARQVVAEHYQEPVEYRIIATKGKGERLDRPELEQIEAMLRSGELDLLVAEDIGRMVRGTEAARLCGIAVDHGTRVIAPNDCIDTAEDSWEEDVISACRDHVGHNAHTSKRLKHKLMNRFLKFGGATAREIYGYLKPAGAKTYYDWQKDPAATPVYQEWFRKLREVPNCSALADWLNEKGVPTGRYSRRKTWNGEMVRRVTSNPLLKGMPGRGFKHTIKHHETGRRVSVKNPKGPQFKEYSHLAHVELAVWDEVNQLLEARNKGFGRKPVHGVDPRFQVPRKRTRFLGQHAVCWYCGRQYVWGGNGVIANLMCCGSREWRCWNSIGFNGALAAQRLTKVIAAELYRLDGFDEQFRTLVSQTGREEDAYLTQRRAKLKQDEQTLAQEKENLLSAIVAYGPKPMLQQKMSELEATERVLAKERRALERQANRTLELPDSVTQLRQMLEEQFHQLTMDSPEFGGLMRLLVPEFHVYLVRLCDGGHLLPRARVKLVLAGIVPDAKHISGLEELLTRNLTLNLFEPPQREQIREEAVRLEAEGLNQREIARQLAGKPTQTAVQHALALDRKMRELGLDNPYVPVLEPPRDYPKLRRHGNAKYRFEPLEEYQRPTI
ncbi:MAG TPA: recombinase family protein [Gemmataceae bacterium]|jgi:hypothetical protein